MPDGNHTARSGASGANMAQDTLTCACEPAAIVARAMSEKTLQANIIHMARVLGYLAYHTRDSRGSAAGFPDLVLVHATDKLMPVVFAELKSERGKVRLEQALWMAAIDRESLDDGFVRVVLWRPTDWLDGTVEKMLRNGTT